MHTNNIEITWADPHALVPNSWNPNRVSPENMEKLEKGLDEVGLWHPIYVRELADSTLEILGGKHRCDILKKRGVERVPIINCGPLDDKKAKEIALVDNLRYGEDDTVKLAELMDDIGDSELLQSFIPMDDATLESILKINEIDLSGLDIDENDDDMGATPDEAPDAPPAQTHQIMRFKVPVTEAYKIEALIESITKAQNFTKSDSLTNAGDALVYVLQGADQKELKR